MSTVSKINVLVKTYLYKKDNQIFLPAYVRESSLKVPVRRAEGNLKDKKHDIINTNKSYILIYG